MTRGTHSGDIAATEDQQRHNDQPSQQQGPVGRAVDKADLSLQVLHAQAALGQLLDRYRVLVTVVHDRRKVCFGRPGGQSLRPCLLAQNRIANEPNKDVTEQYTERGRGVPGDQTYAVADDRQSASDGHSASRHRQPGTQSTSPPCTEVSSAAIPR